MEEHFILEYNSHYQDGYGYNMNYGGVSNYPRSPLTLEQRAAIGRRNKGRTRTPEHREKIRQAHLGKKLSPEHKTKIAAASRLRTHSPETIAKMKQVTRSETFKAARRAFKPSPEQIKNRIARRTSRTWHIQKPDGTIIKTQYLKQTCKEHGVKYIALWAAHKQNRGINRGSTKGWKLMSVCKS